VAAERQLRLAKWGIRPSWLKQSTGLTNARAETVAEKPTFRKAFARQRCLVTADGFYEWFVTDADGKQPFYFRPADEGVLTMAGLVEFAKETGDDGAEFWVPTYTIITTTANDEAGRVHNRMPMVVSQRNWEAWLDPQITGPDEARALMAPPQPGELEIYAVSAAVNNVRNNGPHLLERVTVAG
jgi:putative SOS response-associated peptidase YedK